MMQHYMEFDEDRRGELKFWDHTFPQVEFAKDDITYSSIEWNSRTSYFEERGTDVGSQAPNFQCR